MQTLSRKEVYEAIDRERDYQDDKWGIEQPQSLPGLLLVLQAELNEAIEGWIKNRPGKSAPLNELVQVAAVAVAALEKYGIDGCPWSTDDYPRITHPTHYWAAVNYQEFVVREYKEEEKNDSGDEEGRPQGNTQSREASQGSDVVLPGSDWRECLGGGNPEQSVFL